MNARSIISTVLILFVGASLIYLAVNDSESSSSQVDKTDVAASSAPPRQIVAYYFHGFQRCKTCLHIEEQARLALEKAYPEAMRDSLLIWKTVNFEEEANAEMATRYELVASSLVVVEFVDGVQTDWKLLDKVWDLVWDEEPFAIYVQAEVGRFLNKEPIDG